MLTNKFHSTTYKLKQFHFYDNNEKIFKYFFLKSNFNKIISVPYYVILIYAN